MIHFFRKIRHDLIANNKSYKYFKYAIGEIVLVVLGILIALQINNWNEERKNSDLFDARLVEVEKELIFNITNARGGIDHFHLYDSIASIILFDGLKKEHLESDSNYMYRQIPNHFYFEIQDQAFKNLHEIGNGLTSEQDSLYQNLVSLYGQDAIYYTKEVQKFQIDMYNKIIDSYKDYEWFLNGMIHRPYVKEEIDYYLNNSMFKIDIVNYASGSLRIFNSNIQRWEKGLLKNYKITYDYLEDRKIHHSDSLLFEYDPAQYKHYIGVFKAFETSTGRYSQKMLSEMVIKIELIENKYIYSKYSQGKKTATSEIIPISKHYFRLKKIDENGYYNIIFDENDKVSGLSFSGGTYRFKFKKIE